MATDLLGRLSAARHRLAVLVLAVVAYLPALLSSPGRMPADTKLYLYLDPGRLLSTSASTWDPSLYGGWVPHQMIAYLWPTGPWYWVCDRVGLPDWIAHRVWLGTLLFLAGLGIFQLVKALGMPLRSMFVAALLYQLTPFVLPYVSRTTVMLLPWMSLGWLVLLTMRSVHGGGWRAPALLTLVVCTASPVNATAFAMILPAPLLWLAFELHSRRVSFRQAANAAMRISVLAIPASLWWAVMLTIQNRHGADVLAYSESLRAVSSSNSSTEVVRGLGYWLFYINDSSGSATSAATPYQTSIALILVAFTLLTACLLGLVLTRFRQRRFAIAMVVIGLLLSTGVHPFDHPAPLPSLVRDTGIGLALRSSTRALPLLALGLALGAAALVVAIEQTRVRWRSLAPVALVALIAANIPSLWTASLVDPALERDQDPPDAWFDAAASLDELGTSSRVLQIPGNDFGTFRWGYTVDQPLSGLTSKPVLTRDLIPLGSTQLMDLLYALDNRIQAGSLDAAALAPVARLLAADTIWVTNDIAFDRYHIPRPEPLADLFRRELPGLGAAQSFGAPTVNSPNVVLLDEESISDPRVGEPLAPVQLVPVDDALSLIRIAGRTVVLDGSGDGVVDASAAGLLNGSELVRYAADLDAEDWDELPDDVVIVVTDSNRDREVQWHSAQESLSLTESGGPSQDGVRYEFAQRLPLFASTAASTQTIATLDGGFTAQSTTFGLPLSFNPEYRAAAAVDGDPATGWLVYWEPESEAITIDGADTEELHLLQLQGADLVQMITGVDVTVDGSTQHVSLDASSLVAPGQTVKIPQGSSVRITITDVAARPGAPRTGLPWVGFAELGPVAQEWVRPPLTALLAADDHPTALVFNRDRVRATNRWRSDPEPVLARVIDLPRTLTGELRVTLRLNGRAPDSMLDDLAAIDIDATSNQRLLGVPAARGSAAFDGDSSTSWITPFFTAEASELTVALEPGSSVSSLRIRQPVDDEIAPITAIRIKVGTAETDELVVPAPDADGMSTIEFPSMSGDSLTIAIAGVEQRDAADRFDSIAQLPAAIAEVEGLPVAHHASPAPEHCRTGLLTIDGKPVALHVDLPALLRGEAVVAQPCDGGPLTLAAGEHHVLSSAGATTAIDVDTVAVVPTSAWPAAHDPAPTVTVTEQDATSAQVVVPACPQGCWLVFGQGFSEAWNATVDGRQLDGPEPVAGGANGWFLPPSDNPVDVTISFAPQRTLDLALFASAAVIAVCLALVLWPLVRRRRVQFDVPADLPTFVAPWGISSRRSAVAAAAILVATTTAFVSVGWGVASLAVGAMVIHRRQLRWAGVAAAAGAGALGLVVAALQFLRGWPAEPGWPHHFERLHQPMLFVIVLLLVAVLAEDDQPA